MDIKIGTKIKIINMNNEPQYNGKIGIVTFLDSMNQIHGTWGGCALLETDEFTIIENCDEENNSVEN